MDKVIRIPHNSNGDQVTWSYDHKYDTDYYEFQSTLYYHDFERGRSALNIVWRDSSTNKLYRSGMQLLDQTLKNTNSSVISGKFGFKKQGTSILLKLIINEK